MYVNVTIYTIHGSYGLCYHPILEPWSTLLRKTMQNPMAAMAQVEMQVDTTGPRRTDVGLGEGFAATEPWHYPGMPWFQISEIFPRDPNTVWEGT